MIAALQYAGRTIAVVGLGKSGLSAARALRAGGATVIPWDDKAEARGTAEADGFVCVEPNGESWRGVECVVWSPGIPHTHPKPHPAAEVARSLELPLISDVDILCQVRRDAFYVAVTGTNGKSTTTALIAHILGESGQRAAAGGNLGTPALDLPAFDFTGTYVLELSSYQLELVPNLAADIAVWLNITPDHLSRHGGMDGYIAAKRRIFDNADKQVIAIIGIDDPHSRKVVDSLSINGCRTIVPVSVEHEVKNGISVRDGVLVDGSAGRPRTVCDLKEMKTLPGAHNWQNAACAYAAARARGVSAERIVAAMRTFPGLPHRQQLVSVIEEVPFINDSKATNADAASKALSCYDSILWIAGGQAKEGGIADLAPYFPRIRHVFLIGEAQDAFAATLEGKVAYTKSGTLEDAVFQADEMAEIGDVVLLSPACASFDQFRSFEHRGEEFARIVAELAEAEPEDGEDAE